MPDVMVPCTTCRGTGYVVEQYAGKPPISRPCADCHGSGQVKA